MKETTKRRRHSKEFKLEAVRQLENRGKRTVADVAEGLGISMNMLHSWRREFGGAVVAQREARGGETIEDEVMRLRREVQALKTDREVLKKSIAFFVKEL